MNCDELKCSGFVSLINNFESFPITLSLTSESRFETMFICSKLGFDNLNTNAYSTKKKIIGNQFYFYLFTYKKKN